MRCCIGHSSNYSFQSPPKNKGHNNIFLTGLLRVVRTHLGFKSGNAKKTESRVSSELQDHSDDISIESGFGEEGTVPKYIGGDKKIFRIEKFDTDKYSVPLHKADFDNNKTHRSSSIGHQTSLDNDQLFDFSEYFDDPRTQVEKFKKASFNQSEAQYALGRITSPLALPAKNGSCLGFSIMWLESLTDVVNLGPWQSQTRMNELKILASAIEAAQRQNKYKDEVFKDNTQGIYYRGVKITLDFFGLGVTQTVAGGFGDFPNLIKHMKPGNKGLYAFATERPAGHHATAFCCLNDGSFLFFDPNYGEFHIPGEKIKSFIPQFIELNYGYSFKQELRLLREDLLVNDNTTQNMQYKLVDEQKNLSFIYPPK